VVATTGRRKKRSYLRSAQRSVALEVNAAWSCKQQCVPAFPPGGSSRLPLANKLPRLVRLLPFAPHSLLSALNQRRFRLGKLDFWKILHNVGAIISLPCVSRRYSGIRVCSVVSRSCQIWSLSSSCNANLMLFVLGSRVLNSLISTRRLECSPLMDEQAYCSTSSWKPVFFDSFTVLRNRFHRRRRSPWTWSVSSELKNSGGRGTKSVVGCLPQGAAALVASSASTSSANSAAE
jgi:hypothetical protein